MKTKKIIALLSTTFLPITATAALSAGCSDKEKETRQKDNKLITSEVSKVNEILNKLSDTKYKDINKEKATELIKKANKIITNNSSSKEERDEVIKELQKELKELETKKKEIDKKDNPSPQKPEEPQKPEKPNPNEDKNKELKAEVSKLLTELKELNKIAENEDAKKTILATEEELKKQDITADSLNKLKQTLEEKIAEIKKESKEKNYKDFIDKAVIQEFEPNFIDEVKDQLDAYYTLYYKGEAVTKETMQKLGIEAEDKEKVYSISYDESNKKVLAKAKLNGKDFVKEFEVKYFSANPKEWVEKNDGLKIKDNTKLNEILADQFNATFLNSKFVYNKTIAEVPFIKYMGIERSQNQEDINKEGKAKLIFKFKNTSNKKEYTYEHTFEGLKKYSENEDAILKLWTENKLISGTISNETLEKIKKLANKIDSEGRFGYLKYDKAQKRLSFGATSKKAIEHFGDTLKFDEEFLKAIDSKLITCAPGQGNRKALQFVKKEDKFYIEFYYKSKIYQFELKIA
ncbi:hypothetical protein [Metamycoplasma equirhinis]|uniref:hypothetical protein n=1 Tax=Metamycoplasma equirhinis TaxID=92402 RepID=UPI003593C3F3